MKPSNTPVSAKTTTPKQSAKPLDQSTKDWLERTDKHINRMSTDENYRQLVAKSLS